MKKRLLAGLLAGTLVFSSSALFASESDEQYVAISPTWECCPADLGGGLTPPRPGGGGGLPDPIYSF